MPTFSLNKVVNSMKDFFFLCERHKGWKRLKTTWELSYVYATHLCNLNFFSGSKRCNTREGRNMTRTHNILLVFKRNLYIYSENFFFEDLKENITTPCTLDTRFSKIKSGFGEKLKKFGKR